MHRVSRGAGTTTNAGRQLRRAFSSRATLSTDGAAIVRPGLSDRLHVRLHARRRLAKTRIGQRGFSFPVHPHAGRDGRGLLSHRLILVLARRLCWGRRLQVEHRVGIDLEPRSHFFYLRRGETTRQQRRSEPYLDPTSSARLLFAPHVSAQTTGR